MNIQQKRKLFLKIFRKAEKKYKNTDKRLAAEGWKKDWQTLIATIYSAQSRDETTIPVMESTFKVLPTLKKFSSAPLSKIMSLTKKINYYITKSKNSKATTQIIQNKYKGKIPNNLEQLIVLLGVGRKTANLILSELHMKDTICVDTHVNRLSNVLGLVKTKTPRETELALEKITPKKYWSRINRIFVLWGKDAPGRNRKKILSKISF